MQEIEFSIIMPVYNTKIEYVKQAVNSCINQFYENWELIVVDDGSESSIAAQLDAIASTDVRISVFHKVNEGVSVARNYGVDQANGEYSLFLDADDFFELNTLGVLKEDIKASEDTEVFIFSLSRDYESTSIPIPAMYSIGRVFEEKDEISALQADVLRAPLNKNILVFPYCKCIKTNLLQSMQPCFPPGIAMCEDVVFALKLFSVARKSMYTGEILYHYRQLWDSAVNRYRENAVEEQDVMLREIESIIDSVPENTELKSGFYYEAFYAMQRIIMMKFFHPSAPGEFFDRRKECGRVFREKPYADVFKNIEIKVLPRNQKIKAYMLKFHLYALMGYARNMYFKQPGKKQI